jgi:hypothetical protein
VGLIPDRKPVLMLSSILLFLNDKDFQLTLYWNVFGYITVSKFVDKSKYWISLLFQNVGEWTSVIVFPFKSSSHNSVLRINVSGSIELILFPDISNTPSLQLLRNIDGWTSLILFPFKSSHSNAQLCINVSSCIELILFHVIPMYHSLL